MVKDFTQNDGDPFADKSMSLKDADSVLYGAVDVPASGRVVAKPISIMKIWANPAQPRRAVPNSLQLYWNGNPDDVSELLAQWHSIAVKVSRQAIDIYAVLQGQGAGFELENSPAVFAEYIALLQLAASIHEDGLINPITVIEQTDSYLIESGERRWLAYHLLHQYMGDDYAKVPAAKTDGDNYIWRQATENTARRSLNNVGMARQLALLIMESRRGIDGQTYDSYEFMCPHGTCDRRYYAQVANGNIHRIPKGMGQKIQNAMGLSMKHLSNYRGILKMTDDDSVNDLLWIKADVDNWGIKDLIRVKALPLDLITPIVNRDVWTLNDLLALEARFNKLNLDSKATSNQLEVGTDSLPPVSTFQDIQNEFDAIDAAQGETWIGLQKETINGRRGIIVSEHGVDLVKIQFPDGRSSIMERHELREPSSNKSDSVSLGDYKKSLERNYNNPDVFPDNYVPRREASPEQSKSKESEPAHEPSFGQAASSLTGDKTPLLSDHWNGVLAGIATIAAVRGQANLVGRIQRLRSLTVSHVRSMDRAKLENLLTQAYTGVNSLLAKVGNEYGELFAELDALYFEEGDDEQRD